MHDHNSNEIKEYDVVEIIEMPEPKPMEMELGDRGAIVAVYSRDEFEVECVNSDGTTKWLHTMRREAIKLVDNQVD